MHTHSWPHARTYTRIHIAGGALTEEEALVGAPASAEDIEQQVNVEPKAAEVSALDHPGSATSTWKEMREEASGNVYYYNSVTHETTWDRPAELSERSWAL